MQTIPGIECSISGFFTLSPLHNALSQLLIGGHPPGLPSGVRGARLNLQSWLPSNPPVHWGRSCPVLSVLLSVGLIGSAAAGAMVMQSCVEGLIWAVMPHAVG